VLFAIAAVAYLNADHEEFLFDSGLHHIDRIEHTEGPLQVIRTFWQGHLNPDAPFTYLTFAWNYSLNKSIGLDGFDTTTFLIVNVMIHALNACLVYLLVGAMLRHIEPERPKSAWIPLALAALFAVHPIHASSVAYIIQRRGVLATTFYLLAVLAYLRVRKAPPSHKKPALDDPGELPVTAIPTSAWPWTRIALTATIPILYWFSLRSKNLGVTLPFALLVIEFCLRASDWQALKRYLWLMIPGLVVCTIGIFIFLWMRGLFDPRTFEIHYFGPATSWGPWPHFLTESRVFVHYWKLLFLPLPRWSCIDHDFSLSKSLFDHYAIVGIAFHGLLLALAVVAARRRYLLASVGIFWFYITLMPYAALPQHELLVEYKTYLPSVGLVLILAEGCRLLRYRVPMIVLTPVVAILAAMLLTTTIRRNVIYQSAFNLWSDAVEKYPNHYRPHNNLGKALAKQGKTDEAITHYNEALRLNPALPMVHHNLAITLAAQGKTDEAITHYNKALRLNPALPMVHHNLAIALTKQGRIDDAVAHYRQAICLRPDYSQTHNNLGNVLAEHGRIDEAVGHFNEALRIRPSFAEAHYSLARALAEQGRMDAAVIHCTEALRLQPQYPEAHNNLAVILASQGKTDEAIKHYNEALRLRPDYYRAHHNLGKALARQGKIDEAITHYNKALFLRPNFPQAYYHLADAFVEQGKIQQAIKYYQEALRLKPEWPTVLNDLAWILATDARPDLRNPAEAVRLAERACAQTEYERPNMLDTLAAAYAATGNYKAAVRMAQKAISIATDKQEDYGLVESIRNRLRQYEMGRAYREPNSSTYHKTPQNGPPADLLKNE
jgi:tetratricopeptide (TPR) repeat protein